MADKDTNNEESKPRKSNIIRPSEGLGEDVHKDFLNKLKSDDKLSKDALYIGELLKRVVNLIGFSDSNPEDGKSPIVKDQKPIVGNEEKTDRTVKSFIPVKIVAVSDEAVKQLNGLRDDEDDEEDDEEDDTPKNAIFAKLMSMGLFAMVSFGGLLKSLQVAFDPNNPLTGVATIASKILADIATNILRGIGGLFNVGPIVNIFRSLFGMAEVSKIVKPAAGGLKGLAAKIFSTTFLRRIPFIGSLIAFGIAYKRLKDGQFLQGAIDIVSGLVGLVPGLGWPLSLALDMFNATMDIQKAKVGPAGVSWSDKITSFIMNNIRNMPIIGGFWRMGEALSCLMDGDFTGFFKGMGGGIWGLIPGMGYVYDLLFGKGDETGVVFKGANKLLGGLKSLQEHLSEKLSGLFRGIIDRVLEFVSNIPGIPPGIVKMAAKRLGLIPKDSPDDDGWAVAGIATAGLSIGRVAGEGIKKFGKSILGKGGNEEHVNNHQLYPKPQPRHPQQSTVAEYDHHSKDIIELMKGQNSMTKMMMEQQREMVNVVSMNNSNSSVLNNFTHSTNNTTRRRQSLE